MSSAMIDFPSLFTTEQIEYIGQCVVMAAQQACGDLLRDVILYGSYARGDFKEWSDVDIMVLADADDARCKLLDSEMSALLSDLDYHMNLLLYFIITPYDRFTQMKEAYPYYQNIDKEGKRLCSIMKVNSGE